MKEMSVHYYICLTSEARKELKGMNYCIKKFKLEIVLFIINAIYMVLELIASRILAPYFGSTNIVWTSIIGIILLSTSIGNYLGGTIADKDKNEEKSICEILIFISMLISLIPIFNKTIQQSIISIFINIKIGAIISTILLFFLPSMCIGLISPVIIKLKINDLKNSGKVSGKIYAIATLGSIVGTFLGGFFLIPKFGSNQILFVLSIITLSLIFIMYNKEIKKLYIKIFKITIILIALNVFFFVVYAKENVSNAEKILNGEIGMTVEYDTQYGKVLIYNSSTSEGMVRRLNINRGNESATFTSEQKRNELVYEYTKYYDLMFKSSIDINDALMIGGAGYSYPKYYISHFENRNMDVVEIDEDIVKIAKKYFYLDKLIDEYELEKNNRLKFISEDGRTYLNKNNKKYDAILNDSFSGDTPAKTMVTKEAVQKIYNSLNKNGVYLTNIISSLDGKDSQFLKAEVKTLKEIFKNVYIIPCNYINDRQKVQNNMVVATDDEIEYEDNTTIDLLDAIGLTDNYCPVDTLIPEKYR